MKKLTAIILLLCMLLGLTACGASTKSADMVVKEEMAAAEAPMLANGALYGTAESGASALPQNRKWVITVDMNAETEDLDALLVSLEEKILALNGYVEDQNIHNGSTYAARRYRRANLTIRIPAQDAENFVDEVSGLSNVVSQNLYREDITLTYTSTESRIKALQAEEARLLEFMEKAETMEDLLEIEARLTDVRYELENYTSRLRVYDNQVDYATIHLSIEEVQEYTPVAEQTIWERITEGFSSNLKGLGEDLADLMVWLLATSPYLVVYGLVGFGIFLLVRKLPKSKPRKKTKSPETPAQKPEEKKE